MKFIFGLITGAIAGILLAPDNGKNNVESLKKNFPKYKEQMKIAYNDIKKGFKISQEKLPQEKPVSVGV